MVVYNNKTILGEQLWLVMLQLLIQSPLPTLKENSLKSYLLDVRWNLNHISQNIRFQQEICFKKWLLVLSVGPTLCLMIAFNFMGNLLYTSSLTSELKRLKSVIFALILFFMILFLIFIWVKVTALYKYKCR